MWYAKPSGGYIMSSTEGTNNIYEMHYWMDAAGYTLEAQAAVVANCYNESALNPWRWQGDVVNYAAGYGLFQFTAARDYIDGCSWVDDYAPNLATGYITAGAAPHDGNAQMDVLVNDYLSKWVGTCWRDYWAYDSYLAGLRNTILNTWGSGSYISQSQFADIDDLECALFCFFACYEGPYYISDYYARVDDVYTAYSILGGSPPAPHGLPIWFLFKMKELNFKR